MSYAGETVIDDSFFQEAMYHLNGYYADDTLESLLGPGVEDINNSNGNEPADPGSDGTSNSVDGGVDNSSRGEEVDNGALVTTSIGGDEGDNDSGSEETPQPVTTLTTNAYGRYRGLFKTAEEARAHRKSQRAPAKSDPQVAEYKHTHRDYWVKKIFDAMVNVEGLDDNQTSCHRQRFERAEFDVLDLEATAHNVFDKAIAVHERGWCRPTIYRKVAVRGKGKDQSENNIDRRFTMICRLLQTSKAACNDAIQGGLTLAKLVDNPFVRTQTKNSNNATNNRRKKQLEAGAKAMRGAESSAAQTPDDELKGGKHAEAGGEALHGTGSAAQTPAEVATGDEKE